MHFHRQSTMIINDDQMRSVHVRDYVNYLQVTNVFIDDSDTIEA